MNEVSMIEHLDGVPMITKIVADSVIEVLPR
jgi:hypothetical protein